MRVYAISKNPLDKRTTLCKKQLITYLPNQNYYYKWKWGQGDVRTYRESSELKCIETEQRYLKSFILENYYVLLSHGKNICMVAGI